MTGILQSIASMHLLVWLVPFVVGITLAALGSRLSEKWISVLAVGSIGLPWLQAIAAMVFLLWSNTLQGHGLRIGLDFLDHDELFSLAFDWQTRGGWAFLVCATTALVAQIHALYSLVQMAGRHRYHALVSVFTAAGGILFTADSSAALLFGWEGMGLSAAFLYAFWESEQRGARPGMRWLLFQRLSSLLLLLGLLVLELPGPMGGMLVIASACVRAGQLPFHGWIPDSAHGPGSVITLVHGVASSLAAVFLIDRMWSIIGQTPLLLDVLAIVGITGVVLGGLAGVQQQDPRRAMVWVFMLHTGLALLGFAEGDPTAARILVTAEVLVLGGAILALRSQPTLSTGASLTNSDMLPNGDLPARRWIVLFLLSGWVLPPSLGCIGLGRLLGSAADDPKGLTLQIVVGVGAVMVGWIFQRAWYSQRITKPGVIGWPPIIMALALWTLGSLVFILGGVLLAFDGWYAVGGRSGLAWAGITAVALVIGWMASRIISSYRRPRLLGRLTSTQRIMDRVAESGLGLGELMVQAPTMITRGLGVLLWRGLGDFLIDTLLLGSTVRLVEGVGVVLRYLHNGRIQRYVLVVVAALLIILHLAME